LRAFHPNVSAVGNCQWLWMEGILAHGRSSAPTEGEHARTTAGVYRVQRALAAFRAAALRSPGVSFIARALPPLSPPRLPNVTAAGSLPCSSGVGSRSSTWPLAISTSSLAAWLKSRGRLGCFSAIMRIWGASRKSASGKFACLIQTGPLPAGGLPRVSAGSGCAIDPKRSAGRRGS